MIIARGDEVVDLTDRVDQFEAEIARLRQEIARFIAENEERRHRHESMGRLELFSTDWA